MNIFATYNCPAASATALDDKRAIKMILETAQMLSTAIHLVDPNHGLELYKPTHPNHPCNIWVRAHTNNFRWTVQHMQALGNRYPRHKSLGLLSAFSEWWLDENVLPRHGTPPPFANCAARADMGISYKHIEVTTTAYRLYLNKRWSLDKRPPTWNTGDRPDWAIFTRELA